MFQSDEGNFIVYKHNRKSDGKCFYVGSGTTNRARHKSKRLPVWFVEADRGYFIEIHSRYTSSAAAESAEYILIKELAEKGEPLTNVRGMPKESDALSSLTRQGIENARKNGKRIGGHPKDRTEVLALLAEGMSVSAISRQTGKSRTTITIWRNEAQND